MSKIDRRINNTYAKKDWSINDTSTLEKNKHYKRYSEQKFEIRKKYSERLFDCKVGVPARSEYNWYLEEGQEQWRAYLKELGDILVKPNGDYQEFVWDIMNAQEKEKMDLMCRSRKPKQSDEYK